MSQIILDVDAELETFILKQSELDGTDSATFIKNVLKTKLAESQPERLVNGIPLEEWLQRFDEISKQQKPRHAKLSNEDWGREHIYDERL